MRVVGPTTLAKGVVRALTKVEFGGSQTTPAALRGGLTTPEISKEMAKPPP